MVAGRCCLLTLLLFVGIPASKDGAVHAFLLPLSLSARNAGPQQRHLGLYMISKKEKRRLQESQQRVAALQAKEVQNKQRLLVVKLQDILQGIQGGKTKKHLAAQKLLKTAAYEGLADIGWEARWLALEICYSAQRHSDVKMILSSVTFPTTTDSTSATNKEVAKFGLWAHSMLKDWDSAVKYATKLYEQPPGREVEDAKDASSPNYHNKPFSSSKEQNQLRRLAIQACTQTGRSLSMARKLWKPATDGAEIFNSLLLGYIRRQEFNQAKALWEQESSDSATHFNKISYRLLLQCGAESGDILLMKRAMQQLGSLAPTDSLLVLNALLAAPKPLSLKDQDLVMTTLRRFLDRGAKTTIKQRLDHQAELLSQVLLAVDKPSARRSLFQTYYCDVPSSSSWILSLRPAAKAVVLPFLWGESVSTNNNGDGMKEDAWELLASLVNVANPQKSRAFLQGQSSEFIAVALQICKWFWAMRGGGQYTQVIGRPC